MPSLPNPSRRDCNPSAFLACLKTLVVSRAARSWRARVTYGMRLDWSGMALAIDDHADVQKDATSSAAAVLLVVTEP